MTNLASAPARCACAGSYAAPRRLAPIHRRRPQVRHPTSAHLRIARPGRWAPVASGPGLLYAAFLSDPAPEWLVKGGVITEDQAGDAAAIPHSVSDWLERAQRLLTLPWRQRSLGYERRRSRSRCGVSEGDPEADADQPDYGPEVELVSVEEAHHKSHDHNDDRGNSNPFPFLAIV